MNAYALQKNFIRSLNFFSHQKGLSKYSLNFSTLDTRHIHTRTNTLRYSEVQDSLSLENGVLSAAHHQTVFAAFYSCKRKKNWENCQVGRNFCRKIPLILIINSFWSRRLRSVSQPQNVESFLLISKSLKTILKIYRQR